MYLRTLATAAPTPSPSPTPSTPLPQFPLPSGGGGISVGIGGWITDQINSWFAALVASAAKPLLSFLAATLLATPDFTSDGRVADLWKVTAAMANGSFLLLATIGAAVAITHQTLQTRYAVKEVLPRLALAILITNASLLVCGKLIELANAVSGALLGQDFDAGRAATTIRYLIIPPNQGQIFYILLALVAVILLILLLLTFIMRAAMVLLLVVAAPLALACHALPHTDGLARFWWRAFTGLLIIQIAQSLTLVLAVRIFFNQDGRLLLGIAPTGQLVNLLLALCLLIILVRIPGWISRRIFADVRGSGGTISRIIKYAIAYKVTAPVLSAFHLGKGRGNGGRGSIGGVAKSAIVGKVVAGAIGGPAGTAAASAATAASAARGGPGPVKHAPVGGARPTRAEDWAPGPAKHAPTGPPIAGRYKATPRPQTPVPPVTPVYGYPRENYYAAGPAGLGQMQHLKAKGEISPRRALEPPGRPAPPIISPAAPIPGTPEWPETPGQPRRVPPRRRTRNRRRGGDQP